MPVPQKLPPTLARLYARPGFLLRRAHQISAAVFEDACRPLALTPAQFGALTVLQAHPGLGQSSLARALGFDKVTVLRVLRGLEARGLVKRDPAAGHPRKVSVALTPTLVFTLVLAEILHSRFGLSGTLTGALVLYTTLNTLLPSLLLRVPFDVDPMQDGAPAPLPLAPAPDAPAAVENAAAVPTPGQ